MDIGLPVAAAAPAAATAVDAAAAGEGEGATATATAAHAAAPREGSADSPIAPVDSNPVPEASAAPPPSSPLCTDAHTSVAAAAARLASDEFVWNGLCLRAGGVVQAVHTLYRHHPDAPEYEGPLVSPEVDIAAYEAAVSWWG